METNRSLDQWIWKDVTTLSNTISVTDRRNWLQVFITDLYTNIVDYYNNNQTSGYDNNQKTTSSDS